MYTIMIVDDEKDLREAIISTVKWEQVGYEVIGEAENGLEALQIMETKSPDVIITDIKMPYMSGIEFVEAIRERNPVTKIVFLTGFNDFDYAISAIKYNVIDYLLKPISAEELEKTLLTIKEVLDEERNKSRDLELIQESYIQSLPSIRQAALITIIIGNTNRESTFNKINKYGINLKGDVHQIFTVSLDKNSLKNSVLETDDFEILLFSALNTVQRICGKYVNFEAFIFDENVVGILSDTKDNIDTYSPIITREISQTISRLYGFSVTVGLSEQFKDIMDAQDNFQSTLLALHYGTTTGEGNIITAGEIETTSKRSFVFNEERELQLNSIIKTGTKDELTQYLNEIFEQLASEKALLTNYQLCITEMYVAVVKAAGTSIEGFEINISNNLLFISEFYKYETIDNIREWFEQLCHRIMEYIEISRKDSANMTAKQGYDYIRLNYADPSISLKSVSQKLHISPNYFSFIFKKNIGMSFTDKLTEVRMAKAKDLLLTTGKKIFEISQETGYTDQHYFSYCFKKHYGTSPNQMRSQHAAASG